jgi:hypothetical protein
MCPHGCLSLLHLGKKEEEEVEKIYKMPESWSLVIH